MKAGRIIIITLCLVTLLVSAYGQTKEESLTTDAIKSIQVFPNPTTEFLNVKFESPIAKKIAFKIHNIIGNEISLEAEIVDDFEVRFKVKDMYEGYYILAVQNTVSGYKATYKFLKL
jgi:hypothetical protein